MVNTDFSNNVPLSKPPDVWKECLQAIKQNVTLMTFNTWFLPIKPLELDNSTLKGAAAKPVLLGVD